VTSKHSIVCIEMT